MNVKVLLAVFKRNFVSYFTNPTGYVFIFVFVLLSSVAAFWTDEFFNVNLANLDQLTKYFPFIMLVFIPAITMGIWADERRQGTDELLLTIPAGDFEIVLGKYLATLAIYSVSLVFSFVCNLIILKVLGSPDLGLFVGTYFGYWLVGAAMLAIGMVASFCTGNLTVAYALGAMFNMPLVFAVHCDSILGSWFPGTSRFVKQWSIGEQLDDFARGMMTFAGVTYFVSIVAVMLYLCMILIGRRHWGHSPLVKGANATVRTLGLIAIAACLIAFFQRHDLRVDVTSEQLGSLSDETKNLLDDLEIERPVQIEAFISPEVPETYIETRANLRSALLELKSRGHGKVNVRINETEAFTDESSRAEERYGIVSREVVSESRGTMSPPQPVILGVAFTSGLEKVILPFVDRGIPVEYEVVRSLASVTQQKRKKVGILRTDAQLYGQYNFQTGSPSRNWPIITELEKQYEVEQVEPSALNEGDYDVLLAVQPSSLGPEEMNQFLDAVKNGLPTAIFEDPFPVFAQSVPATSAPRQAPGGQMAMMMGRQQPPPKGNIGPLWEMLGVDFTDSQIVWQKYSPEPRLSHLGREFVFLDPGQGPEEPFSEASTISSKLQYMLFPLPGAITKLNASTELDFTPLVHTGSRSTGTVGYDELMRKYLGGRQSPSQRYPPTNLSYVLAAHIQGKTPKSEESTKDDDDENKDTSTKKLDVVLIADIDMLSEPFFRLREQGDMPGVNLNFDNVTFVLNLLDVLAKDPRFVELRKRRPKHRTLTQIDKLTAKANRADAKILDDLQKEYDNVQEEEQKKLNEQVRQIEQDMQKQDIPQHDALNRIAMVLNQGNQRIQAKLDQMAKERKRKKHEVDTQSNISRRQAEDRHKFWAVVLPPIPPLFLGLIVLIMRRLAEREGVARSRLR